MILHLDIETYSKADLKRVGADRYAEDDSTDLNCLGWAIDESQPSIWMPSQTTSDLFAAIREAKEIHAWGAGFERKNLNGAAGRRYGFPKIDIARTYCSMSNARVHGLPGGLDACANAIESPRRKSGANAMRYLCKPRADGSRPTIQEEPERFKELVAYCMDDVYAEREIGRLIPRMSDRELKIYRELDQPMNDRGWKVDLESVANFEALIGVYKRELEKRCIEMTGIKPSQTAKLAEWIRANGYPELEDLQADTVRKVLLCAIPDDIRTILTLYSTYNMKAVMKYAAMRQAACSDGRVRGMFMFYGAGTGRWSSTIVQLQNLFRPVIDDPEVAVEAARERDLNWIRTLYPQTDPMKVMASCVRSCLIADEGKELLFPDYSGIESRYNAWLWGEEWKLEAYRQYDKGLGPHPYCVVYGRCFNVDPASPEGVAGKQLGKVIDLFGAYEGGPGAFVKMANTYRLDLEKMVGSVYPTLAHNILERAVEAYQYAEEQGRLYDLSEKVWVCCEALKIISRNTIPNIVKGWKALKDASIYAVANPGKLATVANKRIIFKVEGDFLVMRLPSGRCLYYYKPSLKGHNEIGVDSMGNKYTMTRGKEGVLSYRGMNTVTRVWGPTSTYGGRLCENETQAGCRDLLVHAKFRLQAMGLPIIGTVHDEIILEVDKDWHGEEEVRSAMCTNPEWCQGLPLAVEMHRGVRYRK